MSATGTHEIVTPIVVAPRRAPDTRVAAGATTAGPPPASRWRRIRLDLIAYALYALLAAWVTIRVWPGADHRVSTIDANDQAFFEWMLSHGARVVTHFDSPWFTDRMNVPTGVNLMANTSILALSIPMTPITLWLGPEVSYGVLIALGLAGTAAAWYFVMSRRLVTSRWAAGIGGAVAGFGPGIVSHANGHPNIVAQFLVPFIVWRVIRLREPGRAVRNGVILGLLVTVQVFVNEEILFMTGLGLALFIAAYAWKQRDEVRAATAAFLRGLGVAVAVAGVLLAYPLFLQFFGPASYHGLQPAIQSYGTDVASLPAFASRTVLGPFADNGHLAPNPVEENGFLGWPVLIAVAMSMYWLRRNSIAVAAGAAALGLTLLALGPKIYFNTSRTSIPGPWALVRHLPLFDSVVPTRLSLMVLPIVAVLIALAHDRVLTLYRRSPAVTVSAADMTTAELPRVTVSNRPRLAWIALVMVALVSIAPSPVPTRKLQATPAFITDGIWRRYVGAGQTVVPVPLPQYDQLAGMFWAANTQLAVQLPRGYFLGPDPSRHDVGIFGAPDRPTSILLAKVIAKDKPAVVRPNDRKAALADLRYWQAGVVVQMPGGPADHAVRATMTDLLGFKPTFTGGVWVWDVRKLVAGHRQVLG